MGAAYFLAVKMGFYALGREINQQKKTTEMEFKYT